MRNTGMKNRAARRILASAAALAAAFMLALPVAAATVTATDVMIRNSGEVKDDNIIGVLNKGDKCEVLSKSTDSSGIEWFYVKLPNGNTGYVKSEWIDNGGKEVKTVQPPKPQETPKKEEVEKEEEEKKPEEAEADGAEKDADGGEDEEDGEDVLDDWIMEDEDSGDEKEKPSSKEGEASDGTVADGQDQPVTDENAYDPFTDPNAQFSINFVTDEEGGGSWYLYNYDTDRQFRVSDLEKQGTMEASVKKNAASAAFWRTLACILLILVAVAVILFFALIGRGLPKRGPGAGRSRRRRGTDEPEDPFDYDEEPEGETPDGRLRTGSRRASSKAVSDEDAFDGNLEDGEDFPAGRRAFGGRLGAIFKEEAPGSGDEEEDGSDGDGVGTASEEEGFDGEPSGQDSPFVGPAEEDAPEENTDAHAGAAGEDFSGVPSDEEEAVYDESRDLRDSRNFRGSRDSLTDASADEEEAGDVAYGGDGNSYDRDGNSYDRDGNSYDEDDDSYDGDDDSYDGDVDDEEDYEPRKGGFFGFLKSFFSSKGEEEDEDEVEDEEYEYDDYDDGDAYGEDDEDEEEEYIREAYEQRRRPARGGRRADQEPSRRRQRRMRTFDFNEDQDYPEDADLIPAPPIPSTEAPAPEEERTAVREQSAPSAYPPPAGAASFRTPPSLDAREEEEFYADDDDDMEYSFLGGPSRR